MSQDILTCWKRRRWVRWRLWGKVPSGGVIVIYISLKDIQKKRIQNKYKDGYDGAYGGKFLGVEPVSLLANLKDRLPGLSSRVQQVALHIFLYFYNCAV